MRKRNNFWGKNGGGGEKEFFLKNVSISLKGTLLLQNML